MLLIGEQRQRTCGGVRRRSLIQAGFLGALGACLPEQAVLAASVPRPRAVILLWLWGGPSHLDTLDPKPEAPSEYRGPYRAVPTRVDGLQFTELLPRLARRADRFSVIRSLHHGTADHGLAGTVAMTGAMPQPGRVMPHAGSVLSRVRGSDRPLSSFVTIGDRLQQGHRLIQGEGGGILGAVYDPFRVRYDVEEGVLLGEVQPPKEVEPDRAERRRRLLAGARGGSFPDSRETQALDRSYRQAFELIASGEGRRVFELEREPARLRDAYGRTRFGQSCLLGRRLVEAGVPFVQVNWSQHVEAEEDAGDGGWDNHYRNFEMLAERQCLPFDQSCAALLDDLRDRGLYESTVVLAVGEFGRSPKINQMAGRDHWHQCYSALVGGGGIRPGVVVGSSDDRGEYPASRPLAPADLLATVLECAGVTRTDMLGVGLSAEAEPIRELL